MNTLESTQRNRGPRHRARALMRAFGVLGAVALALGLMATSSAQAGPPVWRDEFDSELPDPAWFWVNENPDGWSLITDPPGFLRISTSPYPTGGENLLLRSGAQGNFTIETRVLFEPSSNFQFAGLVIYQDEANFLQFGRAFAFGDICPVCIGNGIYFDNFQEGGLVGGNFVTGTELAGEAYLRLELRGRRVTAFYSANGEDWQRIGRHEVPPSFRVSAVGLTSSQNYGGEENARVALNITRAEWQRLGVLANVEPLEQGRHRGNHAAGRRSATGSELQEAREIVRRWIVAFGRVV